MRQRKRRGWVVSNVKGQSKWTSEWMNDKWFHLSCRYNSLKSFPSRYVDFLCLIDAAGGELRQRLRFDFLIKLRKYNGNVIRKRERECAIFHFAFDLYVRVSGALRLRCYLMMFISFAFFLDHNWIYGFENRAIKIATLSSSTIVKCACDLIKEKTKNCTQSFARCLCLLCAHVTAHNRK